MSSEPNNGKRTQVFLIALATIGVLAILFFAGITTLAGVAFYSVGQSVKSLSKMTTNIQPGKTNFTTPGRHTTYIAGIKLNGEINDLVADDLIEKLQTAKDDSNAIGVLLEVNSPGGSVVPSQEIYDTVKDVRSKKPIVVYVREMAASGAYYSSSPASKIIANRGSMIGSIGVIMNGFEADKLIQFLKISPVTFKTGALKDAGSPTRPVNENDKKYIQGLLETTHDEFVADVISARHTDEKTMKFMSDGRVVLAPQAVTLKLIDAIGTKKSALDTIAKLANQKTTPDLFYYENIQKFSDYFAQRFGGEASKILQNSISGILENADKTKSINLIAK